MKTRIISTSLLIMLLISVNMTCIIDVHFAEGKDKDKKVYSEINSFYEDFEGKIIGWKPEREERWKNIEFETQSANFYEGRKSLNFCARAIKPKQSTLCKYIYDFTKKEYVIPLTENTKSAFVWYIPSKHFSYVGIFLEFSNGRIGYYVSQYYGSRINSSLSYSYVFYESEKIWIPHERNIYEDYEAIWGPPQGIDITRIGLVLADIYGTGAIQTVCYDMLYLGTESRMPREFGLLVTPTFQMIHAGEVATYDIEISAIGEYDEEISLNVSELPKDSEVVFEKSSEIPPFQSKMQIISSSSTPVGIHNLTISAKHGKNIKTFNITLRIKSSTEVKFSFKIDSDSRLVVPGDSVEYGIHILTSGLTETLIDLSIEGLPDNCTAEYSMNPVFIGQEDELDLSLIVRTGYLTPPGISYLTITGESMAEEGPVCVAVVVLVMSGASLNVEISTDRPSYKLGEIVYMNGQVSDSGISLHNVSISIQVTDQSGDVIHISLTATDLEGSYSDSFTLGDVLESGTYSIFVTANKIGIRDAYGQQSFVVGESSDPSIIIATIYSTDVNHMKKAVFSPGETVSVNLDIDNGGADLDGIIWIEVEDQNDIPIQVIMIENMIKNTVKDGEGPITIRISLKLSDEASSGSYLMRGYVSDKMISEGGRFLTHDQGTFQVVHSSNKNIDGVLDVR